MRQILKFTVDVRLRLILTFSDQMKLTHAMPHFTRTDLRFVIGAALAVALVATFVFCIHFFNF